LEGGFLLQGQLRNLYNMISDTKPTPRLMGWFGDGEKLEFFLSVQFISICLETRKGKIIAKFGRPKSL